MHKLKIISLYDKIYYIAIGVLLVSLFKYTHFLIPLYLFFIRKRKYFIYVFIFMSLFSVRMIFKVNKSYKLNDTLKGIVIKVKNNNYTVKTYNQNVILNTNTSLELGDYVICNGNKKEINFPTIPFDYNNYYLKHDTLYYFYPSNIKVKKIVSPYSARNGLIKLFDNNYSKTSAMFYKSLLLGYNDDLDIKDDLKTLGISHMFSISGLHILILVKLLSYIFKERYINIFLIIYIALTGFAPSVIRASLLVILKSYFKYKKYEFSNLDILSIIFIFLLFLNPYYIYDTGFELSFLISFSIIISDFKNYKLLKISLLSFFMSLPLVVNINNEINLLSPLFNILLAGIFSSFFLPLTIFTVFIINFKPYEIIGNLFIKLLGLSSNITIGIINMPSFNPITFMLYYLGLFFTLSAKKTLFLAIILITIILGSKVNISSYIMFFDCGQGDSAFINSYNNKILIDTYNSSYKYLLSKGITHLNYLILTHGHNDHSGDALELLNKIKVDNIIISYFDNLTITNKIKDSYDNVYLYKKGDKLILKKLEFYFLAPSSYSTNENNNSLVFKLTTPKKKILFMGDYENEEELVKYNYDLKSDILKVGHHGSINANNFKFLDKVKPNLAVISVGYNNKYHLPSKSVIDYFNNNNIKTHITYIDKSYKTYI